jgi:hypothetical protein
MQNEEPVNVKANGTYSKVLNKDCTVSSTHSFSASLMAAGW